jgi:hypothetical protein
MVAPGEKASRRQEELLDSPAMPGTNLETEQAGTGD